MKLNEFTYIFGQKVLLVPYKKEHVERYHQWMQSPELQQTTASEPLSLAQEYEMQQTWLNSEDKLTFIVLDRKIYEDNNNDEIAAMIGDTNIFFHENDEGQLVGEAEIMIAETVARGQKRGWEAMCLMLNYASEKLPVKIFEVKIGLENEPSIKMFKKIGFLETSRSEVFKEVTMEKIVDPTFREWMKNEVPSSQVEEHKSQ